MSGRRKLHKPKPRSSPKFFGYKRASPGDDDDLLDSRVVGEAFGDLDCRDCRSSEACRKGVDNDAARDRRRAQRDRLDAWNLRRTSQLLALNRRAIKTRARRVWAMCFAAKRAADS